MSDHNSVWTPKPCDICDSTDVTIMGERTYAWPTRAGLFHFRFRDSICDNCSYPFVSEVPPEQFLTDYYASAFYDENKGDFDFSPQSRLADIQKYANKESKILEIGSGNGRFLSFLVDQGYQRTQGFDILVMEEQQAADKPRQKYDIILSYFLLEHIIAPGAWLQMLKNHAHAGTTFIFEIPDFESFPQHALNHEHFLYPTRIHLTQLLCRNGFELIEFSGNKSREFGLSFSFKPMLPVAPDISKLKLERASVEGIFKTHQTKSQAWKEQISELLQVAQDSKAEKICIWGANELGLEVVRVAAQLNLRSNIEVVDSSVLKVERPLFDTDLMVKSSRHLGTTGTYFIISAVSAYDTIHSILIERGVKADRISGKILQFS